MHNITHDIGKSSPKVALQVKILILYLEIYLIVLLIDNFLHIKHLFLEWREKNHMLKE